MKDVLATLLLQIAIVIALSRVMGVLFAKMRQPQVVGEILAGIMLGPTLLGLVWPTGYAWLFTSNNAVDVLGMLAQIGVVLFLFLVGLEFDPKIIRQRGSTAAAISISGIVVPFALGFSITYPLIHLFDASHQANPFPTALFMGAAMSVTAFPVLARIITERNLQKTEEGGLAIAAAAVDDVLAWTMLAVVVAFAPTSEAHVNPLFKLAMAVVYVCVMMMVVRPFLKRIEAVYARQNEVSFNVLAVLMVTLLLSAFTTEMIGVHALFGAFVAGFVMPKNIAFVHAVTRRLETFAIVFLLPTFFAYAGLKADLSGIMHPAMIGYTLLIIAVACLGKLGGATLAALATGMSMRSSLTLGVLMNTRGLMELIILTVGLKLGVINQQVYGMMVVMALVTTAMAAPLIDWLMPRVPQKKEDDRVYTVLIPVSKPDSGGPLVQMASYLTHGEVQKRLCAVHLARLSDSEALRSFSHDVLAPAKLDAMEPLLQEALARKLTVDPLAFYSRDVPSDIARLVRQQSIDLVLMGYHIPVFGHALLGGVVHRVLTGSDCDVAVYIERNTGTPERILVPFMNSSHDRLALTLAGKIAAATGAKVTIIHVSADADVTPKHPTIDKAFSDPTQAQAVTVRVVRADDSPAEAVLSQVTDHDLVVIGVAEEWGLESSLLGIRPERIVSECRASVLVVRKYSPA